METNHNDQSNRASIRSLVLAAALGSISLAVLAQPVAPHYMGMNNAAGFFMWYYSGGATGGTAGPGMVPLTTTPTNPGNLSGWHTAGNYGMAPTATGVTINAKADVDLPGGKKAPVNFASKVPAAAMGPLLLKLARIAPVLGNGIMIYDLLKNETDFLPKEADGEAVTWEKKKMYGCTTAPCFSYRTLTDVNGSPNFAYPQDAAAWLMGKNVYGCVVNLVSGIRVHPSSPNDMQYSVSGKTTGNVNCASGWYNFGTSSRAPDPATVYEASTEQAFLDSIAAKSGWPSSTSLAAKAVAEAVKMGEKVEIQTPTLSGPASVPGEKTTTLSKNAAGEDIKTERVSSSSLTYTTNNISIKTVTTTTITNITNPAAPPVVTTETKEEEKPPEDPCKVNPDAAMCAKIDLDTPEGTIPKDTKTLTYAEENVFGGGGCPADKFATLATLDGASFKVWDWQQTCALALPLRALVVALATFAAFLILMPGKVET